MATINGYVLLHRSVLKSDIGNNPVRLAIFCHLLGAANHDTRTVQWNGQPRTCERGSFVLSLKTFSESIGIHRSTFRKHLNYLIKRDTVKLEKAREGSMVTFLNYELYQDVTLSLLRSESKIDTGTDITTDTGTVFDSDRRVAPNKELKELKKQKNINKHVSFLGNELEESFETFWSAWPNKVDRTPSLKAFKKHKPPIADLLTAVEKYKRLKPEWQGFCNGATFINTKHKDVLREDYGTSDLKNSKKSSKHMSVAEILKLEESSGVA